MNNFDVLKAYQQGFKEGKEQLEQENTRLKVELQGIRELLKETLYKDGKGYCIACDIFYGERSTHLDSCWLKQQVSELDKIKVVE